MTDEIRKLASDYVTKYGVETTGLLLRKLSPELDKMATELTMLLRELHYVVEHQRRR